MSTIANATQVARAVHNTSISSAAPWMFTGSALTLAALVAYMYKQGMIFQGQESLDKSTTRFTNMAAGPQVKARIEQVYKYVVGGIAVTAGVATVAHITGISKIFFRSGLASFGVFVGAIGTMITAMLSKPNSDRQKVCYGLFTAAMGLMISPICHLDKTIIAQAAVITLGLGSVLSFMAYKAEDKSFLQWEGSLIGGLTAISVASFVAWFFPKTAFAYGVDRLSLYVGFALFCGCFLASSQRILDDSQVSAARKEPIERFNAINPAIGLYLDSLNLFLRILRMLNGKSDD
jgi:FtsH-binding integral membrane protein